MMRLEPMPRPAYLDISSPQSALISYHTEHAGRARTALTELMLVTLEQAQRYPTPEAARAAGWPVSPEEWWERTEVLLWEENSTAVLRDTMRFHERMLEYLING